MNIYIAHLLERLLACAGSLGITRDRLLSLSGKESPASMDSEKHLWRIRRGMMDFSFIYEDRPVGKSFLEFGTGAHAIDLQLAYILGFEKLYTVDINNHVDLCWFRESGRFMTVADEICERFSVAHAEIESRVSQLAESTSIEDAFTRMNCKFLRFDQLSSGFDGGPIDLWFSASNLQRIPLDTISNLVSIATSSMSRSGLAYHNVDIGDIHSQPHYPFYSPKIHRFDFLKHGKFVWRLLNNNAYGSQNRLRVNQFIDLMREHGLHPIKAEYFEHPGDMEYVRNLKVSPQFVDISPSDLAVAHARILLCKDLVDRDFQPHRLIVGDSDSEYYK